MEINELASTGYGVAAIMFAALTLLLLSTWRARPKSGLVALASGATAAWAVLQAIGALGFLNDQTIFLIIEWVRNLAWLIALVSVLRDLDPTQKVEQIAVRYGPVFLVVAAVLVVYYAIRTSDSPSMIGAVAGGLVLSAINLILSEQIYRNAPVDVRSSLRYFCVGIAGICVYDFFIFAWTVADTETNTNHWAARGYVYALFALPIGLAMRRRFQLTLDAHVPRQIVIYSFGAIGIGLFIVVLLLGDYYIRTYAGDWGGVVRIVLFVAGLMAVIVGLVSATVRAKVRVFLTKSFFQYKYDYRKEWLRFIATLSGTGQEPVPDTAVRAVAQIVNSPGGTAWVRTDRGRGLAPIGSWGSGLPPAPAMHWDSGLVRFLRQRQWVIDLYELRDHPARYEGLEAEPWMADDTGWWLIVPLLLGERLLGFIMLQKPRIVPTLNFEDHDLMRTVGRHAATHIEQAESDKRLAEASQFGAYNRLTAFLMHDLNNLIAQQSLVVRNAEKYRHNPEFVDDAIDTIANSVSRMRRLMEQLSNSSAQASSQRVNVREIIGNAVARVDLRSPKPELNSDDAEMIVEADPEKLTTIIEHLVRNAQDASSDSGRIAISASRDAGSVLVQIADDGCGMDQAFVRDRLFRPFDSTKGSESMGIGAYQAREYVRQIGGQLDVVSVEGEGTTFSIHLPLV